MAIGTRNECQADIARLIVRSGRVAFRACDLAMKTRQWIPRLVVIESCEVLPILEVVALLAVLSQAAAVLILVTVNAILAHSQEAAGLVAHLDRQKFRACDVFRRMAAIAS